MVADNNRRFCLRDFTEVMGTTVLQAFEMNIGKTGLGEEEAERLDMKVITGKIVAGNDAPHYYPLMDQLS